MKEKKAKQFEWIKVPESNMDKIQGGMAYKCPPDYCKCYHPCCTCDLECPKG